MYILRTIKWSDLVVLVQLLLTNFIELEVNSVRKSMDNIKIWHQLDHIVIEFCWGSSRLWSNGCFDDICIAYYRTRLIMLSRYNSDLCMHKVLDVNGLFRNTSKYRAKVDSQTWRQHFPKFDYAFVLRLFCSD